MASPRVMVEIYPIWEMCAGLTSAIVGATAAVAARSEPIRPEALGRGVRDPLPPRICDPCMESSWQVIGRDPTRSLASFVWNFRALGPIGWLRCAIRNAWTSLRSN